MSKKRFLALPLAALCALLSSEALANPLPGMGAWTTTLHARDINADGVVDAYYDSSSNLTWLADANLIQSSGYVDPVAVLAPDANGQDSWFGVTGWVGHLNLYGVTDWRLPTLVSASVCTPMGLHTVCYNTVQSGSSELENLIKTTLGNPVGSLQNTGPFRNLQSGSYWTGTAVSNIPSTSGPHWVFDTVSQAHSPNGYQDLSVKYFAWAVHTGDVAVAAVPEPDAWLMAVFGVVLLGALSRKRISNAH